MPDNATPQAAGEAPALPAASQGVIPHLCLDGRAGEAADFYIKAFGARDLGRMPNQDAPDQLLHVHLEINGGGLMLTDCRPPWQSGPLPLQGFNLQLVVADGDAWWTRALEAGCTVIMPFETMFWGDRWGLLRDPFGVDWALDEPAPAAG